MFFFIPPLRRFGFDTRSYLKSDLFLRSRAVTNYHNIGLSFGLLTEAKGGRYMLLSEDQLCRIRQWMSAIAEESQSIEGHGWLLVGRLDP